MGKTRSELGEDATEEELLKECVFGMEHAFDRKEYRYWYQRKWWIINRPPSTKIIMTKERLKKIVKECDYYIQRIDQKKNPYWTKRKNYFLNRKRILKKQSVYGKRKREEKRKGK